MRESIMLKLSTTSCFTALVAFAGLPLLGQAPVAKPPTAEEVRDYQAKFRKEHDVLVKSGGSKRFLPILLEKAEEFAKRGDAALAVGRLLQASELFRQARWQLPYQSPQVPDHVNRILGNLRLRHGQEINDVAFSPDGRRLATAGKDRTVKIWDLENGHELLSYEGHKDHVRCLAFSRDGKILASGGAEADIKLWDPVTGKDIRTIKGKGTYVTSLAYSRDGKTLVASNDDRAMRLYDVATGNLIREIGDFGIPAAMVLKVAFNNDGTILGAAAGNGLIKLWEYPVVADAKQNRPEYWARQHTTGASYDISFSPDNRTLARCGPEGILLYNLPTPGSPLVVTGPRLLIPIPAPASRFNCMLFSKDSKTLFTGGLDGMIRLWDSETGQALGTLKGHNGQIKALVFNSSGSLLASASSDYTVRLWPFDIVNQARDFAGHQGPVWSAAFSPEGLRLVSASSDRTVKVWDVASGKVLHNLTGHQSGVTVALFSPDGKTVLSAGGDKLLRLWEADGKPLREFKGHEGTVTAADFSPDGGRIVSGGADKRVKVWDVAGAKEVLNIDTPSVVAAVAFSPDGKKIASGHIDQSIRLYDAQSGKELNSWVAHGIAVSGVAFSPDGQWLASCGADHLVRLWPLPAKGGPPVVPGTSPITLAGHTGPLSSVAFRKDSRHIVSGGSDGMVKLWKLENATAKEAQNFRGHTDWVTSVAFSRDGFYVVSASVDRTLKIWEITDREIPLLSEHTGAVLTVAVSPDGKLIASGAGDKTIKLWERETGIERMTLYGHTDDVLSLAFSGDGKTLVSSSADRTLRQWDVQTGKEFLPRKPTFTGLINPVPYLLLPTGGNKLLAWVPGNERYTTITGFDLATGNELFSFNDTGRHVYAVAFTPAGNLVALGAKDGGVRIYDLDKKGQQLPGGDWFMFDKGTSVGDIAFTPDGKQLVVGHDSGDIKIADVAGRKVLHTLKGHKQRIGVCIVSPDGKRCATAGFDNVVKLWDLANGKELRSWDMHMLIQERGGFIMNMAFTPDNRQLVTANANSTVYVLDLP
jgi:WD40 repeat protein